MYRAAARSKLSSWRTKGYVPARDLPSLIGYAEKYRPRLGNRLQGNGGRPGPPEKEAFMRALKLTGAVLEGALFLRLGPEPDDKTLLAMGLLLRVVKTLCDSGGIPMPWSGLVAQLPDQRLVAPPRDRIWKVLALALAALEVLRSIGERLL